MSKKSKKKAKKREKERSKYYGWPKSKKNKKSKKDKKAVRKAYRNVNNYQFSGGKKGKKELKTLHPTLTPKEIRANHEMINKPVKVPDDFKERRVKCNHVGGLISAKAFKNSTPSYAAYTPALDPMIEKYGEENVSVCDNCFDVVVSRACVTSDDVRDAKLVLYAAGSVVVSNYRMKRKEIKRINRKKMKDFTSYGGVCKILDKIHAKGQPDDSGGTDDPLNSLNNIHGSAFIG